MTLPNNAKALVAAVLTAIAPTAAAAVPGAAGVGTASTIESLIGAVVSYLGVYWTTNGKSPKAAAADLGIRIQLDAEAFLASLTANAPDLLRRAVQAAIKPALSGTVEASGSAPVTGTLTSGPVEPPAQDGPTPTPPVA